MKRNISLSYPIEGYEALLSLFDAVKVDTKIGELCTHTLGIVQQVTGFSTVVIRVHNEQSNCLRLIAQSGMSPDMVKEVECVPAEIGFCGDAVRKMRPIFTMDIPSDPRSISPATHKEGFKSLASVPMVAGHHLMGTIELISKEVYSWDQDELSWLALMGRSIGSLIHHLQFVERMKNLAVLEERSRLAQEIHDGSIQLLGSLHFWAEAAQTALLRKDESGMRVAVEKIDSIARDAYAGLREEMLGLRAKVTEVQDIVALLKEFIDRFQRQWGIEAHLFVHRSDHGTQPLHLDTALEVQLLRIVQESLINVRRHANASRVVVTLEEGNECLKVTVQDDGQGFKPESVAPDRLGLLIMRERGNSVGGDVKIVSQPGQGTAVEAKFPING